MDVKPILLKYVDTSEPIMTKNDNIDLDSSIIDTPIDYITNKSDNIEKINPEVVKYRNANKVTEQKYALTQNQKDALFYLTDKNITSMIMGGKDTVSRLLFPLVNVVLEGEIATSKEKEDLKKRLKKDYEQAQVLLKNEFQKQYIDLGQEGIEYFKKFANKSLGTKIL